MSSDPEITPDRRVLSDARALRALAHPVRIALLELLIIEGPHTATEASARLGDSPSNCSFHLRLLAKHDFVEEAGGGTGRRRPWKATSLGLSFSSEHADPAAEIAADALSRLLGERQRERLETWRRTRAGYLPAWREAAIHNQNVVWMTAEELGALSGRLTDELAALYRERLTEPSLRPAGAVPVELLLYGYPLTPAATEPR